MASCSDAETILADDEWRDSRPNGSSTSTPSNQRRPSITNENARQPNNTTVTTSAKPKPSSPKSNTEACLSPESSLSSLDELSELSSSSYDSIRENRVPYTKRDNKHNNNNNNNNNNSLDSDSSLSDLSNLSGVSSLSDESDDEEILSISSHNQKSRYRQRITDDLDSNSSDNNDYPLQNGAYKKQRQSSFSLNKFRRTSINSTSSIINDLKNQDAILELLPSNANDSSDNEKPSAYQQFRNRRKPGRRRKYDLSNPNQRYKNGTTQLTYFVSKGDTEVCEELLTMGADINLADSRGWLPIHEAARLGNIDTLKLLLNPPPCKNSIKGYNYKTDKYILSPFPKINAKTYDDQTTPLHEAVKYQDIQVVSLLIEHGASVNIRNSKGLNSLEICSDPSIAAILSEQLSRYKAASHLDRTGQTKLHKACSSGNYDEVVRLIKCGIDVNSQDNAKWIPLHEASLKGHDDIVCILIRYGADVNAKGLDDQTSLHDACSSGYFDIIKHLIQAGADTLCKNLKGETPKDVAENDEVVSFLNDTYSMVNSSVSKTKGSKSEKRNASAKNGTESISSRKPLSKKTSRKRNQIVSDSDDDDYADQEDNMSDTENHSSVNRLHSSSKKNVKNLSEQKEKLSLSVKRLKEEAERPNVNYYFSSTASGLSREERKIQRLMSTFKQMERSQKHKGRKRGYSPSTSPSPRVQSPVTPSNHKAGTPERNSLSIANGRSDDSKTTPKRKRGRPPKRSHNHSTNLGSDEQQFSDNAEIKSQSTSPAVKPRIEKSKAVGSIDIKSKRLSLDPVPEATETIDITKSPTSVTLNKTDNKEQDKSEVEYNYIVAERAMRYLPLYTVQLESEIDKDRLEFFVVDFQVRLLLNMPIDDYLIAASSDSKDLRSDVNHPKIKKEDGVACQNTLFERYPNLWRKKVTKSQKERIWSPLTNMFVSNVLLIDEEMRHQYIKARSEKGSENDKQWRPPNCHALRKMTNQEKARFMKLDLYFVQLDQVVEIVKDYYPHLSHSLMTITLDIGYHEFINGEQNRNSKTKCDSKGNIGIESKKSEFRNSNSGEHKMSDELIRQPPSSPLHKPSMVSYNNGTSGNTVTGSPRYTRPLKMLPLKYAMKIQHHLRFPPAPPSPYSSFGNSK
ncbi:hypothetical protein H4219_005055 [Mycoemilia scoparia]|uniref:DUF7593 domain-containing protein n=1 Tax=Mycoemilia scoparia TaxID=417184 RepID=A0A9W8DKH8_9FUNG|nr:hypothetical protein H4219_005055 [Mycoemilia scoparia]